ncbi:MAG TPA: 50S ribosomal protein L7ae [Clostridia bacterium]|nr:50S ribosomal protein L7ae [Clostridia bacterium]
MERIEGLLGFAARAGKAVAGEQAVRTKLRYGKIHLILLAEDASKEVISYFSHKSREMGIPVICTGTKVKLGWVIGKSRRAVVGISDRQFAKSILARVREKQAME